MPRPKEWDSKMVGCEKESDTRRLWKTDVHSDVCLSFVSMRVAEKKEGYMKRMDLCRDQWKDGWKASLSLYLLLPSLLAV